MWAFIFGLIIYGSVVLILIGTVGLLPGYSMLGIGVICGAIGCLLDR
jgi:hypothetical protein